MAKIKSIRKKYRQKKRKAKLSQKAYVRSLNKMLEKFSHKEKDPDS